MASKRRKAVADELGDFIERAMRRLTIRVFQVLTFETPVATGFARAGWSPSTGAPDRSGPDKPAAPPGKEGSPAFIAATAQANALFSKRSLVAEALAAGYKITAGPVFIVNNVRYIIYLDDPGSSAQAPKNYVEMALAKAVRETERELRA